MNAFFLFGCLFFFFSVFSIQGQAMTAIRYHDGVFPEIIHSGRALAMGNAFVARVDDESAPFYNPAGLGSFRDWKIYFSNILLEGSDDFFNEINDGPLDTYNIFRASFSIDRMRKLHREKPGYVIHNRYSLAPNFTRRYMSFGYLHSRRLLTYYPKESSDGHYEIFERRDTGPYAGVNFSFGKGTLKVGATLALLSRREVVGRASIDEKYSISQNPDLEERKGVMALAIGGLRYTYPVVGLPTFALVIHNPFKTEFSEGDDAVAPQKINQNIVYGLSVTPFIARMTKLHLELNYKDAKERDSHLKTSHRWGFGAEVNYNRSIYLRLGVNQGLLAGGLGASTNKYKIDLSTYAEPKNSAVFPDELDRRFVFSFSFSI